MKSRNIVFFHVTADTGMLIAKWYWNTQCVEKTWRPRDVLDYLQVWKEYRTKAMMLN